MGRDPLHTWPVDRAGVSRAVLQPREANLNNPWQQVLLHHQQNPLSALHGELPCYTPCSRAADAGPGVLQQSQATVRAMRPTEGSLRAPTASLPVGSHNVTLKKGNEHRSTFYPIGQSGSPQLRVPASCCSPELSGGSSGTLWLKGQPPILALRPYFSQAFPPRYPGLGTWQQLAQSGRPTSDKVKTVPGT